MSVAEQITRINNAKADIRQAIIDKGVDVDESAKIDTYAEKIGEISGGGGSESSIEYVVDSYSKVKRGGTSFKSPAGGTDVTERAFAYAFFGDSTIKSVDFSALTTITAPNAFQYALADCPSLETVDFRNLTTIGSGATSVFNYAFRNCTSLKSVRFDSLQTISKSQPFAYAFQGCAELEEITFPALSSMTTSRALYIAFLACASLKNIYFPAVTTSTFGSYKDQFENMISNVTGCTLHFPAGTESAVSVLNGYPNFGGTNTVVLFDL